MYEKREVWMPIAVAIALIGMWEFCVDVFHIPLYLLPSPSRILISLYENRSVLFSHAMVTLVELCWDLESRLFLRCQQLSLWIYPRLFETVSIHIW